MPLETILIKNHEKRDIKFKIMLNIIILIFFPTEKKRFLEQPFRKSKGKMSNNPIEKLFSPKSKVDNSICDNKMMKGMNEKKMKAKNVIEIFFFFIARSQKR